MSQAWEGWPDVACEQPARYGWRTGLVIVVAMTLLGVLWAATWGTLHLMGVI